MTVSSYWQRGAAYAAMVLCAIASALYLGQDMNWDMLNYHVYSGFSAIEQRLATDYFAASTESYLNPYAHVPLYLMLKHGLAPQAIVAALALIHALTLLLVYETAILLNRRQNGEVAWFAVGLAVFLAFFNPVFLLELGNTFNEITTGVLVLAGWYLLVREFERLRPGMIALAGLLIGMAVSLKLSNMFFSVTALPLLLLAGAGWKLRLRAVGIFALAGLAGALLAGGWWAWQLWNMFGNPFFPLFNHIFHSPDVTDAALKHYRFLPDSLGAYLFRPFAMVAPREGVHVETVSPDLRYAALLVVLVLTGLKYLLSAKSARRWPASDPFPRFQGQRALLALGVGVLLAWIFWLSASGNSRYFLPMGSMAGVLLASLIVRFSESKRFLLYGAVSLAVVQAATVGWASDLRWSPVAWGKSWFELQIPAPLRQQPYLYLHMNSQSASFLLPFLPPGSSMINPSGSWTVEENARIRALMQQYSGRIRVMRRFQHEAVPTADSMLLGLVRFGLEADMESCQTIKLVRRSRTALPDAYSYYFNCKVRPLQWPQQRRDAYATQRRRADALFARLELLCPQHFQPRGLASESDGRAFWRHYSSTDLILRMEAGGMVSFSNEYTYGKPFALGPLEALERALPDPAVFCR